MQAQESPASYNHVDPRFSQIKMTASSSRILYDIPCRVCRDHSSGKHYGIFACDGCAGFFKRSIRRNRKYACKTKPEGACVVDKTHRNQCRACRLAKCVEAGMNKDAVQHERGPRNSTLRRQMALYFKDPSDIHADLLLTQAPPNPILQHHHHHIHHNPHHQTVLDLALPKPVPNNPPMIPPYSMTHQPTSLIPPSAEQVCESAATLLLMNVKWAKNVPAFAALAMPDQLLLIEDSWRELFILGAAHLLPPIDLVQLLHASGSPLVRDCEKSLALLHEVKVFQETLARFAQMRVDPHEFSCLRAIVLFKTSVDSSSSSSSSSSSNSTGGSPSSSDNDVPSRALQNGSAVAALQDHTQLTLNKYIATAYAGQPLRFGKLLLLLPVLRSVSGHTIEELFFRKTIGNIPIEKIICDMYKAETYLTSYC